MIIKLEAPRNWKTPMQNLRDSMGINAHVSERSVARGCRSAYKYIIKQDNQLFLSEDHPNLEAHGSPKTKNVLEHTTKRRSCASAAEVLPKVKLLTPHDVT